MNSKFLSGILILAILASVSQCNTNNLTEDLENPGGVFGPKVFVTSAKTDGNFAGSPGFNIGGCSGNGVGRAVCVCQFLAQQAGLKNSSKFLPWLSENSGTPIIPRCMLMGSNSNSCTGFPNGVWYNTKKEIVATSGAALLSGTLMNPIRYTETGADNGAGPVFTGSGTDGNLSGTQCATAWTSNTGLTTFMGASNRSDSGWTAADTNGNCATQASIYCFERQ